MPRILINGANHDIKADAQMPLLWAIRDIVGLTGTKFGCGIGACGACTVHLDGQAVRSCITSLAEAEGHEIFTIEGLSADGLNPHDALTGFCRSAYRRRGDRRPSAAWVRNQATYGFADFSGPTNGPCSASRRRLRPDPH